MIHYVFTVIAVVEWQTAGDWRPGEHRDLLGEVTLILSKYPGLHFAFVQPENQSIKDDKDTMEIRYLNVSTVRPSKSGSKSCQTWPFLFSKYGYQELVCTRTSGWLYPCVNIHMVIAW